MLVGSDFLMRVMQIREDIESAASDQELKPLLAANEKAMEETLTQLQDALNADDMDEAVKFTAQLQYWNRIAETLREKMECRE
jgi:DnaJ-domain-containing protein 1